MADTPAPRAAGALVALGLMGGALIGAIQGQPSAGLLIGGGAGAALCLALWLRDRHR